LDPSARFGGDCAWFITTRCFGRQRRNSDYRSGYRVAGKAALNPAVEAKRDSLLFVRSTICSASSAGVSVCALTWPARIERK